MSEESRELAEHIKMNAQGALEKAAEGRYHSAFDEFYVGMCLCRAAMNADADTITPEWVELVSRLAWAQAELERGRTARVPDDLERVRELSDEVS